MSSDEQQRAEFSEAVRAADQVLLTPQQLAEQELGARMLSRRYLLPFIMRFNPSYDPGWVHKDICTRLEQFSKDVAAKKSPRLMVFLPPRSGKSEIVSRNFPAWHLGQYPHHEFIATSYSSSLALKFSKKVRALLREPGYEELFPKCQLDPDTQAAESWQTTNGGAYMAAGVSGPLTGNGMHCVHFSVNTPTNRGNIPISEVRVGDEVLGYDHERATYCWTPVLAVATQFKTAFVSVNGVICTPDHRVWTLEKGYVAAAEANGCTLRMLTLPEGVHPPEERAQPECPPVRARDENLLLQNVRGPTAAANEISLRLRAEESGTCAYVQNVLPPWKARVRCVRAVRDDSDPRCGGGSPERYADGGAASDVLLQGVLRRLPSAEPPACQNGFALPCMSRGYNTGPENHPSPQILFSGVLRTAEVIHEGIFGGVEQAQAVCGGAGREHLCALREGGSAECSTSPRPRCGEFCVGESSASLRALPQPLSSSQLGTCASDLTCALPTPGYQQVVDIQTGTGNFFCGEVPLLVHNCGIIDDPVKNREEADSETTRASIKEWYTSTFYTRLAPGAGILIVLTRWHHDDLAGWLLEEAKNGGDQWETVVYPAEAEEDELYRLKGEALHPARYDLDALARIRRAIGPRDWQALYQQRPTAVEGAFFKKGDFRYYNAAERPPLTELSVYTAWDLAIGQKADNDRTAGITVGIDRQHRVWLLDLIFGRLDALEICDTILDTWVTWRSERVGIERGHISMAIGPLLEKRIAERGLWGFPYDPEGLKPGRADKMSRAMPIQGRVRQGVVLFPRDASWLPAFESELLSFPNGTHDDMVDCFAWIGQMMSLFSSVPLIVDKPPSWKDKLPSLMRKQSNLSGGSSAMGA